MTAIILIVSVVAGIYAARGACRRALARQAAQDAAALAQYTMRTRHSSAALAAPYDESKAAAWHQQQTRQAAYRRGRSRKAQDSVKPATVPTPFRKVK
jgi:glucose-6-phosphate isomerase